MTIPAGNAFVLAINRELICRMKPATSRRQSSRYRDAACTYFWFNPEDRGDVPRPGSPMSQTSVLSVPGLPARRGAAHLRGPGRRRHRNRFGAQGLHAAVRVVATVRTDQLGHRAVPVGERRLPADRAPGQARRAAGPRGLDVGRPPRPGLRRSPARGRGGPAGLDVPRDVPAAVDPGRGPGRPEPALAGADRPLVGRDARSGDPGRGVRAAGVGARRRRAAARGVRRRGGHALRPGPDSAGAGSGAEAAATGPPRGRSAGGGGSATRHGCRDRPARRGRGRDRTAVHHRTSFAAAGSSGPTQPGSGWAGRSGSGRPRARPTAGCGWSCCRPSGRAC